MTSARASDPRQKVRMTRHLMAAGSSMLVIGLLVVYWQQGYLQRHAFIVAAGAILALVVGFNVIFRAGLNTRFRDPSLTMPQIATALAVLVYVSFNLRQGGGAFMLVYIMAILFGVFRLTTRALLCLVGPVIVAHAFIVANRIHRGDANADVELVQWLVLCVVMIWFAQLGGYLSRMRNRLNTLATRDELTGVYNRRQLLDMLASEKARVDRHGGTFTVALFDIDRFKHINDTHGHSCGDAVLQEFAKVVTELLRESDYFGRYGGEEFMLVLPVTDSAPALLVVERIRKATRMKVGLRLPNQQTVTVSAGVHQYRISETLEEVVNAADAALYAAKRGGRDRVVMDPASAIAQAAA